MYSHDELIDLAVRASTIDERLSGDFVSVAGSKADTAAAAQRLASWCQSASGGNWPLFAKRLRLDGLTIESIMPALSAVEIAPDTPLPVWIQDLIWIGPALQAEMDTSYISTLRSAGPIQAFDGLYFGLIAAAEIRRDALTSSRALDRVTSEVRGTMIYDLLTDISRLCAPAAHDAFLAYRHRFSLGHAAASGDRDGSFCFDAFCLHMRAAGLRELFNTKPVLLRLLAGKVRQWIDTTSEFLRRLDADFDLLSLQFFGRSATGAVNSIKTDVSDKHNSGRSVYVVSFTSGASVVYKPKDLTIDANWAAFLQWLNSRQPPIDLRAPHVVPRDGYGWCEFISYCDCADEFEVQRFFERAGALLCISYILAASDLHQDNLIAAGEHPVIIDLETLLHAVDLAATTETSAVRANEWAKRKLANSVLSTGLLPCFLTISDTDGVVIGGLHDVDAGEPSAITWKFINTDRMEPVRPSALAADAVNVPRVNGVKQHLVKYVDCLSKKCEEYFRFVHSLKPELLSPNGPLGAFARNGVRHILRPTQFYFLLLQRLLDDRYMWDGAVWSAHLDFLSRLINWDKQDKALWPVTVAERRALGELNIPFFSGTTDSSDLCDGRGALVSTRLTPGLSTAYSRIAGIDDGDIAWQLNVIRLAVSSSSPTEQPSRRLRINRFSKYATDDGPIGRSKALSFAERVFRHLEKSAVREERSAAWIALNPVSRGTGWNLSPLGHDLYSGNMGVCLFLAAFASVTDQPAAAALAQEGLAALRHEINGSDGTRMARTLGLGAATGMGSVIYGLTVIAELLRDEGLLLDACKATRLLTDDVIEGDIEYDAAAGAAGCILGLLKLYRVTGDRYALSRSLACGNHLLRSRPKDSKTSLWRSLSDAPLTGLAHGVAGISYALGALAVASAREEYAAAARDCIAYENELFSAKRSNWPDLRWADKRRFWPVQWCHGAGGIGLARLGVMQFGPVGLDLTGDVKSAIAAVRRAFPLANDSLCCGNLGNVEFLREAGRMLGRDDLTDLALSRMSEVIHVAEQSGGFRFHAGGEEQNIGFFQGSSGVGYSLLRIVAQNELPNVLIWQ
jgi:type 2 lantibiotic biosynthesis protein LanM